jgi:HK97 family phage prohead protease
VEYKSTVAEVKSASNGTGQAIFSRFGGPPDSDNDITLPTAFEDGKEVLMSAYNHASWGTAMPVGKGIVRVERDLAYFDFQLFLGTTAGRDTYELLKEGGHLMEWSYGFDVLESEEGTWDGCRVRVLKRMDVHEVSPVLKGAGRDTQLVGIKSADSGLLTRAERHELLAFKEQLRRDELIELLAMRRRLHDDMERAAATAELEGIALATGYLVGYREVAPHDVQPDIRKAAHEALAAYGPGTRLRWFTEEPDPTLVEFTDDRPKDGFCFPKAATREIWARAGVDTGRAYEVVAHEIAHLDGADEEAATVAGIRARFERGWL